MARSSNTELILSIFEQWDTEGDGMIREEGLRRVVRQTAVEEIGKKPEVVVVISRLS